MRDEEFEWDDEKAVEFLDTRGEHGEDRNIRIGSIGSRVLVVSVAFTERDHRIRIISAMTAPRKLRRLYEEGY